MLSNRARLGLLWTSQVARVLADWALRITAVLAVRANFGSDDASSWHLVTAVYITPFILLAPFHGCLSNALPRRWVLTGAALYSLLVLTPFLFLGGPWVVALGAVALGSALYSATRYAMLPAAARDGALKLTTVNGWIELGGSAAIVAGVFVGVSGAEVALAGLPPAVLVALGLNMLCVLTAIPCAFPSDLSRPESPGQAFLGFFRDCGRVMRCREAAGSLAGLALFQAVVTAGAGVLALIALDNVEAGLSEMLNALVMIFCGVIVGSALAALQGNPRRCLGLIPLGLTGLAVAQAWGALAGQAGGGTAVPCLLLGMMAGLINVPLRASYQLEVPADARGNAMAVMNFAIFVLTVAVALALLLLREAGLGTVGQLWLLTGVVVVGAAAAWRILFPQTIELVAEWVLTPMYRVRAHGPGVGMVPLKGPLLVVANHSSYFDPFWIGKLMPRHVRPLMTSRFYDLPVIRWLMVHVVRAIRVQETKFRREAPELRLAVEELKQGGCVLIFPEAILRRTEERLLRNFGQGVWRILRDAPDTQVVVCWIEGGWGSYASYKGGPPMKNKKPDYGRRIDVAIEEARVLPAEVLADQRATRRYLMRACLEARRHLGLPVPEDTQLAPEGDEEDVEAEALPDAPPAITAPQERGECCPP